MKQFQGLPCTVCGKTYGTVGHHILTKGSRPDLMKKERNILPLCWYHHDEIHGKRGRFVHGLWDFVMKYNLWEEMSNRGYEVINESFYFKPESEK